MKKKLLKILLAVIIFAANILAAFPNIPGDIALIFLSGPPSPKSDVPITYSIGWWNNQNRMTITKLSAKIIESKLSLFNSKSLFQYTISGILCYPYGGWKPEISEAHLSERYIKYDTDEKKYIGEINITPVVRLIDDKSYKGDTLNFRINLQEIVESANWGKCIYIIKCFDYTDSLVIHQYK